MGEGRAEGSWTVRCASASKVRLITLSKGVFTRENSHRHEFHMDDLLILYRVHMIMGHFTSGSFEGILHVDKINVRFKIANITNALPFPGHRQTEFTPKRVVVSCSHDTVARFRYGVKLSPRYSNRGEPTPGWLTPAWHFVVVSCKQM